jgi:hypothetical protein
MLLSGDPGGDKSGDDRWTIGVTIGEVWGHDGCGGGRNCL